MLKNAIFVNKPKRPFLTFSAFINLNLAVQSNSTFFSKEPQSRMK
jgi:hypothetical protein